MVPKGNSPFPSPPVSFSVGGSLEKNQSDPLVITSHVNQTALFAEEEEDVTSLSVPSSPTLKSPMHQKLSHSCDDLLGGTTPLPQRPPPPPPPGPSFDDERDGEAHPSITITTPGRSRGGLSLVSPEHLYGRLEEDSEEDDDFGSESELEMLDSLSRPLPGSVNPMVDILGGMGSAGSEEEEEGEGGKKSDDDSSTGGGGSKGKFGRFRDKFRNPFSRSRSPQPEGEDRDSPQKSPSPLPEDEGTTAAASTEEHGLQSRVTAAVRQRFKVNSRRKMRRNSPAPSAPSEEELAQKKSAKSRMIYIS